MQKNKYVKQGGYDATLTTSTAIIENLLKKVEDKLDIIEVDKILKPDTARWAKS